MQGSSEYACGIGRISLFSKLRMSVPGIPTGFCHKAQGCEERATLGEDVDTRTTLNGLWPDRSKIGATPLGLVMFERIPRVARSSQPWAGGRNPFGIEREDTSFKTEMRPSESTAEALRLNLDASRDTSPAVICASTNLENWEAESTNAPVFFLQGWILALVLS